MGLPQRVAALILLPYLVRRVVYQTVLLNFHSRLVVTFATRRYPDIAQLAAHQTHHRPRCTGRPERAPLPIAAAADSLNAVLDSALPHDYGCHPLLCYEPPGDVPRALCR